MNIYTIGSGGKSAQVFFHKLESAGIKTVADIRLNNTSQLAGFTKKNDLKFFLNRISSIEYIHLPELAPDESLLKEYRNGDLKWKDYEIRYISLIMEREATFELSMVVREGICFLCSEDKPDFCHRRLLAEYIQKKFTDIEIIHL